MKRAVMVLLQFLLLLVVFLVGSLLPGAKLLPMISSTLTSGRLFVWDGLLLMLAVYGLLLLIAGVRRRFVSSGANATIALALALVLGLAMKFGFVSA